MQADTKQVAITGGLDWYDASVDFLTVPAEMDLHARYVAWRKWYDTEYCAAMQRNESRKYISFVDSLKLAGATDGTIEVFAEQDQ